MHRLVEDDSMESINFKKLINKAVSLSNRDDFFKTMFSRYNENISLRILLNKPWFKEGIDDLMGGYQHTASGKSMNVSHIYMARACKTIKNGDQKGALFLLNKALQYVPAPIFPSTPLICDLLLMRAEVLKNLEYFKEAQTDLREISIISIPRGGTFIYYLLFAESCKGLKNIAGALHNYKRALKVCRDPIEHRKVQLNIEALEKSVSYNVDSSSASSPSILEISSSSTSPSSETSSSSILEKSSSSTSPSSETSSSSTSRSPSPLETSSPSTSITSTPSTIFTSTLDILTPPSSPHSSGPECSMAEKIKGHDGLDVASEITPPPSPASDLKSDFYCYKKVVEEPASSASNNMPSMKATRGIQVGRLILEENPIGIYVLPEFVHIGFCSFCETRILAAYYCMKCIDVAYCSPSCRTKAQRYHLATCKLYPMMRAANLSVECFLSCQLLVNINMSTIKHIHQKCFTNPINENTQESLGYASQPKRPRMSSSVTEDETGAQSWDNYYDKIDNAVHDSCASDEEEEREISPTLIAKYIDLYRKPAPKTTAYKFIEHFAIASFIRQNLNGHLEWHDPHVPDPVLELLMANLNTLSSHTYVKPIEKPCNAYHGHDQSLDVIGVGVYLYASKFSHTSCYPNIHRYFDGTRLHLRAISRIDMGESLRDSPCGNLMDSRLYHRRCNSSTCRPCLMVWPTLQEMKCGSRRALLQLRCLNSECTHRFRDPMKVPASCPDCNTLLPKDVITKKRYITNTLSIVFNEAIKMHRSLQINEAILLLEAELNDFHSKAVPPFYIVHKIEKYINVLYNVKMMLRHP